MLSYNQLAVRQLTAKKGRTVLIGLAICIGVATMLSLMTLGSSGSTMIERQSRAEFGSGDIRALLGEKANTSRVIKEIAKKPEVEGVALEKWWLLKGSLGNDDMEFLTKAINARSSIAEKLYHLSSGRLPEGKDEIALSATAAGDLGLNAGKFFNLPVSKETRRLRIVGLIDDGPSISSKNIKAYVDIKTLGAELTRRRPGSDSAQVVLKEKRSMSETAQRIEGIDGVLDSKSVDVFLEEVGRNASMTSSIFGAMGAIALVIGGTLVYTAFAVTASEREREFALFKAVGAEAVRLRRLVYREAVLLGLVFSCLGIPLGYVASFGLLRIGLRTGTFSGFGPSDLSITASNVFLSIAVGVGVTLFSALFPAVKIGRTHPLATMRPEPTVGQKVSVWRWSGLLFIVGGTMALAKYSALRGPESTMIVPSVLAIYIGAAVFLPILIGPLFTFIERISPARIRAAGKLAAAHLGRESARTARSATSILLGVSLVGLVAIMTSTTVAGGRQLVKEQVRYDISIAAPRGTDTLKTSAIPAKIVEALKKTDGVDLATAIGMGSAKLRLTTAMIKTAKARLKGVSDVEIANKISLSNITAVDDTFSRISGLAFAPGTNVARVWSGLSGDGVILRDAFANYFGIKSGDTITLLNEKGEPSSFRVLALTDISLYSGSLSEGGIFMSREDAKKFGATSDSAVLIKLEKGVDKAATVKKIKGLVKGTGIEVLNDAEITRKVDRLMEGPIALLYAFFAVTILVSLLGVINTVAIGALQRRREIGLIRGIGATRRQMRSMIFVEAGLISLTGVILGIALSTGVAIFFVRGIDTGGIAGQPFTFPVGTFVTLLASVLFASTLGAVFPARFANEVTPVQALRAN